MNRQDLKEKLINKLIFESYIVKKFITQDPKKLDIIHKKNIEEILELRALFNNKPTTLQEANTIMICIKRSIKQAIENYYSMKGLVKDWYDCYKKVENTDDSESIEKCVTNCNQAMEYVESLEHKIKNLYFRLEMICEFYEKQNISLDYFCSLVGINLTTARLNIKDVEKYIKGERNYYLQLLDWGIEDAREEEEWKSNRNGMPFFDLCKEYVLIMFDTNSEVKEKMHNMLMDEFVYKGGLKTYKMEYDENGDKQIKENYPTLKVIK